MSPYEVGTPIGVALTLYQITWPCMGTEVFLERLGRWGPAVDRRAWILMGD